MRDNADEVAPWWPLDPARVRPPAETGLLGSGIDQLLNVDPPDPPDGVLVRLDELDVKIRELPVTEQFLKAYQAVITDDEP